jgi:RNA polymerase sigma-70 factor, ECF subfamily
MHTLRELPPIDLTRGLSFATLLNGRSGNAVGCVTFAATSGQQCHAASIVAIATPKDRAAFSRLFEHFAPRLKSYFQRGGLDPAVAEGLAQEVMLAVWSKAQQYDPARLTAATWIYGIASNCRVDHLRRRRVEVPIGSLFNQEGSEPPPDAVTEADETARRMQQAIAELPPDQISALHLAFFEDRSHADIHSLLGIPLGTIKSRLRLALDKLRDARDCA